MSTVSGFFRRPLSARSMAYRGTARFPAFLPARESIDPGSEASALEAYKNTEQGRQYAELGVGQPKLPEVEKQIRAAEFAEVKREEEEAIQAEEEKKGYRSGVLGALLALLIVAIVGGSAYAATAGNDEDPEDVVQGAIELQARDQCEQDVPVDFFACEGVNIYTCRAGVFGLLDCNDGGDDDEKTCICPQEEGLLFELSIANDAGVVGALCKERDDDDEDSNNYCTAIQQS